MGYRRPGKIFRLKFEDGDMAGLEAEIRGLSVEGLLGLLRLADVLQGDGSVAAKLEKAGELFTVMADRLVSWNYEDDDGQPVPVTRDALAAQDLDFLIGIVTAWIGAIASVDTPLPGGSPSGGISPEASLALASSSESLPS